MEAYNSPTNSSPNGVLQLDTGNTPIVEEVSDGLAIENRTISSVDQAYSVCTTLVSDWKKGIMTSARITAKINGERPYNQKKLKDTGKDYKTNISTGFLATECNKVLPRLYMPLKTAKYLTAAALPSGWAEGDEKTEFFRQTITESIRAWSKWNFYLRGLAREVGIFGFGFNVWFDEWEWRPNLMRMDKGFVPQGTEVMDLEPQFFMAKYDYSPNELLEMLRDNMQAGREEWKKENVVKAVNGAQPPPTDATYPNARTYEELIRQATWGYRYEKGYNVIKTWHLFAKEATGKVSHYIVLSDSNAGTDQSSKDGDGTYRLLYENLDQFDSMQDCVNTIVFDFGDGTVHGSWGVGQILYDLAAQVEKIRCDSVDNMRNTNKLKIQVPEAKNINDVKLSINDQFMIVSGATLAGTTSGISGDISGYELLDQKLTQIAQQKIGSFVPPIPLQPSDIKAAQINAAMMKEKELQEALLENWLIQCAVLIGTMTKRLCKPGSPDQKAIAVQNILKSRLTDEEIQMLAGQFPIQSVMDFTEYKAQQRAMFAQSVMGNPLFDQETIARTMASGAGDDRFVQSICVPHGDQSKQMEAQRQQLLENASIALGQATPVLPKDNDWIHMQTMKPGIDHALRGGNVQVAQIAMQHYAGHYQQGVAKKGIPDDQINAEKQYISEMEKVINDITSQQQMQGQPPVA